MKPITDLPLHSERLETFSLERTCEDAHVTAVKGERNRAKGLLLKGEGKLFFTGEDYPPWKPEELTGKLSELTGKFIEFLRKN